MVSTARVEKLQLAPKRPNELKMGDTRLSTALPEIAEIVQNEMKTITSSITESQQFISSTFDDFVAKFTVLCDEFKALRRENAVLRNALENLQAQTKTLQTRVDDQETAADSHQKSLLASHVIVSGVPNIPNENVDATVEKVGITMNCHPLLKHVVSCVRMKSMNGQPCPPIKIIFDHPETKTAFVEAKIRYGKLPASSIFKNIPNNTGNVTIRNELSPLAMKILKEVRSKQKSIGLQYVWPGMHGEILVKANSFSKPIKLRTNADLRKLISTS